MSKNIIKLNHSNHIQDWLTIKEAVNIVNKSTNAQITDADIYRHALCGDIFLSLYFQSPVFLSKIIKIKNKIKMKYLPGTLLYRLCYLNSNCFINNMNLTAYTDGHFIQSSDSILDTSLAGHEYVSVQYLLAKTLKIPPPLRGKQSHNFGISLLMSGNIFQAFERTTWRERIHRQVISLPLTFAKRFHEETFLTNVDNIDEKNFFPLYDLPADACFVIRRTELEKLFIQYAPVPTSTRTSSALARFFWLACRHNESIRSLIAHPYKLLPIFEQWARDEGITDNLSADTLKAALERGSPFPGGHSQ
ncbi:TPA: hypothetical protein I8Y21_005478 [Klebsiella oxytoca]|uniref:Uncharacterized protein n=1 Tax=Klebsiella oxytoca TaxID=571 RepID=A0AAN5RGB9_KLEOX|nr:hypothetical protein [Klebsiella oxytoca]